MNANKEVMAFFPEIWTQEETKNFIFRMKRQFKNYKFCYFAVDVLDSNEFIGFIGLSYQTFKSEFTPSVDIGWRLIPEYWGKGFATEGALACLNYGFEKLNIKSIIAISPQLNIKSQTVMLKLGMTKFTSFTHPNIDKNNSLKNCVAYRIINKNI
jgi:RimJ/RimL family protein N-acetyltransferase